MIYRTHTHARARRLAKIPKWMQRTVIFRGARGGAHAWVMGINAHQCQIAQHRTDFGSYPPMEGCLRVCLSIVTISLTNVWVTQFCINCSRSKYKINMSNKNRTIKKMLSALWVVFVCIIFQNGDDWTTQSVMHAAYIRKFRWFSEIEIFACPALTEEDDSCD